MGMTISTEGIGELGAMLARLGAKADEVASYSLYEGAGIVADAYKAAVNGIATEPFKYAPPGKTRLPSPEEKAALLGKSGIAGFNHSGDDVNTIVGISGSAGYANVAGKAKAVRLIARSINSGTSFMKKQPVFRKAANGSKGAAQGAIVAKAEEMFNEIIGG